MKKDLDIVGVGSVVLDLIIQVQAIGAPDSKTQMQPAQRYPGGVVLNHLCWAGAMGAKAALAGQGSTDEADSYLRAALDLHGVDHHAYTHAGPRTALAQIYVDGQGERAIYLEAKPIALNTPAQMRALLPLLKRTQFVSTEISMLPLPTVLAFLQTAKRAGARSVLDLDIPASKAGALGRAADLNKALGLADLLKCSLDAALELLPAGTGFRAAAAALHRHLRKKPGSQWIIVTGGKQGATASNGRQHVHVPVHPGVLVKDSTGAGDAFLGGLMAGLAKAWPMQKALRLASACGAIGVQSFGATPAPGAADRVRRLCKIPGLRPSKAPTSGPAKAAGAEGYLNSAASELSALAQHSDPQALKKAQALIEAALAKGGKLHVTGIGKCEPVARYIASSFSSTGTPAFFLHGTEAVHGSSGQLRSDDLLIALSNSGETAELKATVSAAKRLGVRLLAVTAAPKSWLASQAAAVLLAKVSREGDQLGLAPRNSVLAQMALLNALGVALQESHGFSAADFRRFHPGGSLGAGRARRKS